MKKVILIILIVCFLAAVGFYAYQEFFSQKELEAEDLLPFGAVAYSHTYDLEGKLVEFSKSKLAQGFSQISIAEFMSQMGAQPHEKMIVDMVLAQINAPENRRLAGQFFGQEVAIAVYPTDKKEFGPEMWKDAGSKVMIVTRLKPEVRFIELITPIFSKFNQQVSQEELQYKKHTIYVLKAFNNFLTVGYVRFGDLLVLGWGDQAARRAIDVVNGDIQSLGKDPLFRDAFPARNEKTDITFFHYAVFAQKMKEYVLHAAMKDGEGWSKQVQDQFEEGFKQMIGFKTFASVVLPGKVTGIQSIIRYDPQQLHPDVLPFYQARPQENKSLSFVPTDALYYQWQGGIDFMQHWMQAKKQMQAIDQGTGVEPGASPDQFVSAMEGQLGMSVEKGILPLFGDEMGGFLTDIVAMGAVPIPKLAVFIEVKDAVKMAELLNNLLNAIVFFQIEHEEYQNVYFRSARIPMIEGVELACGVFEQYMMCTTSRDLFRTIVDVGKGGGKIPSMKENAVFANPQYKLARPSNGLFFMNVPGLMDKFMVLIDVFEQWVLMQQSQQKALRSGAEKRLEDIEAKIAQGQEEFNALEEELLALEGQRGSIAPVDTSRVGEIEQDIARQQKIRESFEARLQELLKEEQDLLAVETQQGQKLSDAGKEKLAVVQGDIVIQKERLAGLESKIAGLTKDFEDLNLAATSSQDIEQAFSSKEKQLLQIREEIRDDQEIRQEIEMLLTGYDQQDSVSENERMFLVNKVIKPVLAAFKNLHWIAGRMEIQDRAIQSDMMFKYE